MGFRRNNDKLGEAHALVLQAQLQMSLGSHNTARELAQTALVIYQQFGDTEGKELSAQLINFQRPLDKEDKALMPLPAAPVHVVPDLTAPSEEVQRRQVLEQPAVEGKLRVLVSEAVDVDEQPAMDTPLMEMGLDSLASVSFRNEVAKEFDMTLPASLMFDYPTLGELTSYIVERSCERQ